MALDKKFTEVLRGKCLSLVTDVPSMRTKASVCHGMTMAGGSVINLTYDDLGQVELGEGLMVIKTEDDNEYEEDAKEDVNNENGRSLGALGDAIAARSSSQGLLDRLAADSSVPVINMSSDLFHPIKALSYLVTWLEEFKYLSRLNVTWVGQNCNLLNSLMFGCGLTGVKFQICTPVGYEPDPFVLSQAFRSVASTHTELNLIQDFMKAIHKSDVVVCGAWNNVPEKKEKDRRKEDFKQFRLTESVLREKTSRCKVMHQLPWSEVEITKELMFNQDSLTWKEIENRKFAAMAVLVNVLGDYRLTLPEPTFDLSHKH